MNKILVGDCLIKLKELEDNSVDSIVTDPPYELGFMGKSWDNTGIANNPDMWRECLRVLKPGGYLLSFSGTRTYHRMASAIEDAGFEVRDMIEWVYGSGFPKSLNIGKAVDKLGGQSLSWFIDYILKVADDKGISRKELTMLFPSKNGNPTGWLWNKQKTQGITLEQYHKIKEFLQLPFADITECEREVVGRGKAGLTAGTIANFAGEKEFEITKGTSEWEGWGTALKPAHEPICMARKPLGQQELDIAKNICYNITEKGLITNSKIIWRIKNVKGAEKQKMSNYSTPTQLQKTVEVSAEFVEMKGNESVGKKIQKLIDSTCESGIQETGNKPEKQVLKAILKTKIEYQDTGENINTNEKQKLLKPTEESASVVENQDLSSLPLTTLEVAEDSTEKKSKMETSMSSLKSTDTQKTDTDCYAQTATSQWVCMDIVRTLKVSFEGKEYDFIELSDGSLVWNENLEPYRKQQKLNVAENVLKYGTGGINIDESRVGTEERFNSFAGNKDTGFTADDTRTDSGKGLFAGNKDGGTLVNGRFPANLIHDNSEEVRECFPESKSVGGNQNNRKTKDSFISGVETTVSSVPCGYGDEGSASRFFKSIIYQAKASKSERNKGLENLPDRKSELNSGGIGRQISVDKRTADGSENAPTMKNHHPTVKPIALMEYLIKMVTPKGGIVLDPFSGSFSTGVACVKNGFGFIGIEREEEYVKIGKARMEQAQKEKDTKVGLFH